MPKKECLYFHIGECLGYCINKDVDIMLEAKAKDEALFKLIRQLKYKTDYTFFDETSFYI